MSNQEFLKSKNRLKCCRECGDDECTTPCEQAEYRLDQNRLNRKFKSIKYPGQSEYVKGGKILLELPNEQWVVISRQAREVLDFHNIDEPKFVQSMIDLLQGPMNELRKDSRGFVYSGRHLSVSRAVYPWDRSEHPEEYGDTPHIQIDIWDFTGMLKNGAEARKLMLVDEPIKKGEQ
jgi:hypothetical protein